METLSKKPEIDDPFEMVQQFLEIPADDRFYDQMARTFIEEYMMMGWSDDEILALFRDSFYRGTYEIREREGEGFVKKIIQEVRNG